MNPRWEDTSPVETVPSWDETNPVAETPPAAPPPPADVPTWEATKEVEPQRSALGEMGTSAARGLGTGLAALVEGGPVIHRAMNTLQDKVESLSPVPTLTRIAGAALNPVRAVNMLIPETAQKAGEIQQRSGAVARQAVEAVVPPDPARSGGVQGFVTQAVPEMAGKIVPAAVLSAVGAAPAVPFVLGAQGATEGAVRANEAADAANLPEDRRAAVVGATAALGSLQGVGGVAGQLARKTPLGAAVLENVGIGAVQTVGENVAMRSSGADPKRGIADGLLENVLLSAAMPAVIHGTRAAAQKLGPAPTVSSADVQRELAKRYGNRAVTRLDDQTLRVEFLDGKRLHVRMTPDVTTTPEGAQQFIDSARAENPQIVAAAEAQHPGDVLAIVDRLKAQGMQAAGRFLPKIEISDPAGKVQPTTLENVILLSQGLATRGTLGHEQFHAALKLAGLTDDQIKTAGRADDVNMAEENLAKAIERGLDNPVRSAMSRLAERFLGKKGFQQAAQQVQQLADEVLANRTTPSRVGANWQEPTVPRNGNAEQGSFQGLETAGPGQAATPPDLPQQGFRLPPDIKPGMKVSGLEGRKWNVRFENAIDEATYRYSQARNSKQTDVAQRMKALILAQPGWDEVKLSQHEQAVRKALREQAAADGRDPNRVAMTVPAVPEPTPTKSLFEATQKPPKPPPTPEEIAALEREAAERAQREKDLTARLERENEEFKRRYIRPEPTPEELADLARRESFRAVKTQTALTARMDQYGAREEMQRFVDALETSPAPGGGVTRADLPALRKFMAGEPLTDKQLAAARNAYGMLEDDLSRPMAIEDLSAFDAMSDADTARVEEIIRRDDDLPFSVTQRRRREPGENLAIPGTDPRARERMAQNDELFRRAGLWQDVQQRVQAVASAQREFAMDPQGATDRVLSGRINFADAKDTALANLALNEATMRGFGDEKLAFEATLGQLRYRLERRELARALGMGVDVIESPEMRRQNALIKMSGVFSQSLERRLQSTDPAKFQEAKAEWQKLHNETMEQWKRTGVLVPADGPSGGAQGKAAEPATVPPAPAAGAARAIEPPPLPGREAGSPNLGSQTSQLPARNVQGMEPGAMPVPKGWKFNPEILADQQKTMGVLRELATQRGTWGEKWYEMYRNFLMSALKSQTANATGNALNTAWRVTGRWAAEAMLNQARKAAGLKVAEDAATWKGIENAYRDLGPIIWQAGRDLVAAWRTESSKFYGGEELIGMPAISGLKGKAIRWPQRANAAVDEFFMSIAEGMTRRNMAARLAEAAGLTGDALDNKITELTLNPPETLRLAAIEDTLALTFKDKPGALGDLMLRNRDGNAQSLGGAFIQWVLKFNFPFIKTPINILRTGLRASPVGALRIAAKAATGKYRQPGGKLTQDLAEQAIGLVGLGLLWQATNPDKDGIPTLTGSNARYGKTRRDFLGNIIPPRSIRIGGKWHSYARIEPLATYMQATADILDGIRDRKELVEPGQIYERAKRIGVGLVKDRTYLQQLDTMLQLADEEASPQQYLAGLAAGALVPNAIRDAIRAANPNVYGRFNNTGGPEDGATFADEVAWRATAAATYAPGLKRDFWGRPITKPALFDTPQKDFLYRLLIPVEARQARALTNFERMLWRYYTTTPGETMPGAPEDKYRFKNQEFRMSVDEYADFAERRGRLMESMLQSSRVPWNFDDPKPWHIIEFKKIEAAASRRAREELIARKLNGAEREQFISDTLRKRNEQLYGIKPGTSLTVP